MMGSDVEFYHPFGLVRFMILGLGQPLGLLSIC